MMMMMVAMVVDLGVLCSMMLMVVFNDYYSLACASSVFVAIVPMDYGDQEIVVLCKYRFLVTF